MKQIISQISFNVHEKNILSPTSNILCTISGGQDSILLLFILVHLKKTLDVNLELIYCHHFWQKLNFYSAQQLFNIGYFLNMPLYISIAHSNLISEEKARLWRRKNFFRVVNFSQSKILVTGHNATDKIETGIWHLLRGTSPNGIISLKQNSSLIENSFFVSSFQNKKNSFKISTKKFLKKKSWTRIVRIYVYSEYETSQGVLHTKREAPRITLQAKSQATETILYTKQEVTQVPFDFKILNKANSDFTNKKKSFFYCCFFKKSNTIEIIRPLLSYYREDIGQIVKENKLPVLIDTTNGSLKLARNKIRLLILPLFQYYLKKNCNNQIVQYLDLTNEEQKFLSELLLKTIKSYCQQPALIQSLFQLPQAIQYKIIHYLLNQYIMKQTTKKQITNILQFGSPGTRTRN